MTLRLTILGCGSSTGVPRIDGSWGACNPDNPKNRRSRCSVLVENITADGKTVALIDTSPDVRTQLLNAGARHLDGVIYTHDHADHTHGIDDLRILSYAQKKRIDVYATARTMSLLRRRFDYCFETPPGSSYPAIVKGHVIGDFEPTRIEGRGGPLLFQPFPQLHGDILSLGLRVGGVAYSSDLHGLPDETLPILQDLDIWIIDALRYTPHPSHLSLPQALEWIERIKPKQAILTHLHIDLDYDELAKQLPPGVVAAFDGMVIEFPNSPKAELA